MCSKNCSLRLALPNLDAQIASHIDERCEDVAVWLQQSDVFGNVKRLGTCLDVELGVGPPFNANYLPISIQDLLKLHHPAYFADLTKDKMSLRPKLSKSVNVVEERLLESESHEDDDADDDDEAEFSDGDSLLRTNVDPISSSNTEELQLPDKSDLDDMEQFFATFLGKKALLPARNYSCATVFPPPPWLFAGFTDDESGVTSGALGPPYWNLNEAVVVNQVFEILHGQWSPRFTPFNVECKLEDEPISLAKYNSFIQVITCLELLV
jgi:hypothetical protein